MNTDGKSFRLSMLAAAIALLLVAGIMIGREGPRFNTTKIPSLFIAKNWPTNQTDRLTISSEEFTCLPNYGMHSMCEVMLDGKRLEMTASYMPIQTLKSCTIVYGGTPYACEAIHNWGPMAIVGTDMGISAERMAELRAERPLTYMNESTWMGLGLLWAAVLASLTTLFMLTAYNRIDSAELVGVRIPIWLLCLVVIRLAVLVNQVTGMGFVFPIGMIGPVVLLLLIMRLNKRDRKQGPSLAHPLMWASVSLVAFWLMNLGTLFGLMWVGYLD